MAYVIGLIVLLVVWAIYGFSSRKNVMELARGKNGIPSSSQFQFLLWTIMVIFAYATVYADRAMFHGQYNPMGEIPVNLLALMGISGGSMVISKGIDVHNQSRGTARKGKKEHEIYGFKYLVCDEDGMPALNKVQMMAWTIISIGVYVTLLIRQVNGSAPPSLPDVDSALLVLMGVSQGTYLGKKLISTTTPILQRLDKDSAKSGDTVILTGKNFGSEQAGGTIKISHGKTEHNPSQIDGWIDTEIKIVVPSGLDEGPYDVSVEMGSKESNRLTLEVKK